MKKKKVIPEIHKDLEGFDIRINSFGEIETSMNIEKLNQFLDKNLVDVKLSKNEEE